MSENGQIHYEKRRTLHSVHVLLTGYYGFYIHSHSYYTIYSVASYFILMQLRILRNPEDA